MAVKQIIVLRKDLNMRKGKMVAQGAHASMKIFFDRLIQSRDVSVEKEASGLVTDLVPSDKVHFELTGITGDMAEWIYGSFTKICVSVSSEEELNLIYNMGVQAGIPAALIIDNGATEFGGVKTATACALGPAQAEILDPITGHLPLL
jgi:PTH2 family peptidyl-tRNA hydrolase